MEQLDYKELEILVENVTQKIRERIIIANRTGALEDLLKQYDCYEEQEEKNGGFYYNDNAKIIVIGSIEVKQKEVDGCLKTLGIDKDRVEFYTDYEKLTNMNFNFIKNNMNYSDVLVCSMPHKMAGIGDNSSFIQMIEDNTEEYPHLVKIEDENGKLKYSNTAFKKALMKTNLYKNTL